jgi:starvation-inducible DNA-binding protein
MNELTNTLRMLLGDIFIFAFKSQSYHWNVKGFNFTELHAFFGTIYVDAFAQVDVVAEYLRIEGELAPKSLVELYTAATLKEDEFVPGTSREMIQNLVANNAVVISDLNTLFDVADRLNAQGIADYASARLDTHKKLQWMLKSHLES